MAHTLTIQSEGQGVKLGFLSRKEVNANEQIRYWRMKKANALTHAAAVEAGARVKLWEMELAAISKAIRTV